jgi:hypothetical protein
MSTKTCRHCQSEIDSRARSCPQCQKRQRVILSTPIFLLAILVSFLAGFFSGGRAFIKGHKHISTRPTGVETQPRQTWRITDADFERMSNGTEFERVASTLGPPTVTWWEEKTALVAIWANPDSSNLTLSFEPNETGRFVVTDKTQVDLPPALPRR